MIIWSWEVEVAGRRVGRKRKDVLRVSNIPLMTPLMQAASRWTTYSKPSLEMRVMYLLGALGVWLEVAMAGLYEAEIEEGMGALSYLL